MQGFNDILRQWLGSRPVDEAAADLRVASRTLEYLLAGTYLPAGVTLALIEDKVAAGVGLTVAELRAVVAADRARRHRASASPATIEAPADTTPIGGAEVRS